mmetsp:Transcript_5873/g.16658  ORF Transcript_5873/g.16658 Transcript_5873/m.16658 type:complete len:225 (-) Transcript_5873:86-760(-)
MQRILRPADLRRAVQIGPIGGTLCALLDVVEEEVQRHHGLHQRVEVAVVLDVLEGAQLIGAGALLQDEHPPLHGHLPRLGGAERTGRLGHTRHEQVLHTAVQILLVMVESETFEGLQLVCTDSEGLGDTPVEQPSEDTEGSPGMRQAGHDTVAQPHGRQHPSLPPTRPTYPLLHRNRLLRLRLLLTLTTLLSTVAGLGLVLLFLLGRRRCWRWLGRPSPGRHTG